MTYPQQPYGGQDPYGQPPPQYGAYDPAAQYGTQQFGGGYGGGFNAPPPKKKTGAIVAMVAVVVLVLGGLGFTGFVEPGFFLSNEKEPTAGGGTTTPKTTESPTGPEGAQDFLKTLVDGLDSQDAGALEGITCPTAGSNVEDAVADISSVNSAELVDSREVSADEVVGTIEVTTDSRTGDAEVTITQDGGDWCWQDIAGGGEPTEPSGEPTEGGTPTAGGKPVDAGALSAMQTFLDSVNAGDAAKAKNQLCQDAISTPAEIDQLIGYQPDLEIDPATEGIAAGGRSFQVYLRGTANGEEVDPYSTNLWVTSYDGPWCVHAFRAVII